MMTRGASNEERNAKVQVMENDVARSNEFIVLVGILDPCFQNTCFSSKQVKTDGKELLRQKLSTETVDTLAGDVYDKKWYRPAPESVPCSL